MSAMTYRALLELVFQVATECHREGPGYAQQSVVLTRVGRRLPGGGGSSRTSEQQMLTCWHDLFRMGKLSWGYYLDNPNAPFFHIPPTDPERDSFPAGSLLTARRG